MYRILSLDGGGIRGLLATRLLQKIDLDLPKFWTQFDLIAGTSTGAIPALGLAAGISPADLSEVYQESHAQVFKDSAWDNVKDLLAMTGAQYSAAGLKRVLANLFGQKTLGDLQKRVIVPAVHLDNQSADPVKPRHWKTKFFHNFAGDDSDAAELVVDVALRSTAAPVYFPIYQGYVDGGLAANNPSMCALVQALKEGEGPLEEIALFSVGTGLNPKFIPEQEGDWGLLQWAYRNATPASPTLRLPLIEMIFEVSIGLADYQCRQFLGERYHRLNPILKEPIDLDDGAQVYRLNQLAGRIDLKETITWLKRHLTIAAGG
jgi:patatin-like phospholipase/acyl hydrolase